MLDAYDLLEDPNREQVRIETWRLKQLLDAGYPIAQAEQLAARADVDLHVAVELVTVRRCPPDTAYRILL